MEERNDKSEFGERLRAIRLEQGMTQERLCELSGLERTYVSQAERGQCNPTLTTISRLARALGVSKCDLIGD